MGVRPDGDQIPGQKYLLQYFVLSNKMPTFAIGIRPEPGPLSRANIRVLGQRTGNARSGTRQNHRENKIRPFPGVVGINAGRVLSA